MFPKGLVHGLGEKFQISSSLFFFSGGKEEAHKSLSLHSLSVGPDVIKLNISKVGFPEFVKIWWRLPFL